MWNEQEEDNLEKLQERSLVDQVEEARAEKLAELRASDVTNIDIWVTEVGFVSPYPDRVIIHRVDDVRSLLSAVYDITSEDEIITGTILAIEEGILTTLIRIAEDMELTLGYLDNPDVEFEGWEFFTRAAKTLGPLDIANVFEPLHLPNPELVSDPQPHPDSVSSELNEEGINGED